MLKRASKFGTDSILFYTGGMKSYIANALLEPEILVQFVTERKEGGPKNLIQIVDNLGLKTPFYSRTFIETMVLFPDVKTFYYPFVDGQKIGFYWGQGILKALLMEENIPRVEIKMPFKSMSYEQLVKEFVTVGHDPEELMVETNNCENKIGDCRCGKCPKCLETYRLMVPWVGKRFMEKYFFENPEK